MDAEKICDELYINNDEIVNIYPYGSRVYGTAREDSDHDYIVVYKSAILKSGAFRDNAISSKDKKVQAVCYSRSGFQDAINNYEAGALEAIFLPEDQIVKKKWPFKVTKWDEKTMVKKMITKASASWHAAVQARMGDNHVKARRGIFQALRILMFAEQMKKEGKMVDYTIANSLHKEIMEKSDDDFHTRDYLPMRDKLMGDLRK